MAYGPDLESSPQRWQAQRPPIVPRPRPGDPRWRQALRTVVAARVVPHLLALPARQDLPASAVSSARVTAFAALLPTASLATAMQAVEDTTAEGASMEAVLLDLFAPAARHLGDEWLADRLSFLAVTQGSAKLQAMLRLLAPAFEADGGLPAASRSIFLAPVPGEQHVFGLSMLASFFRRAGWQVAYEPRLDREGLLDRVRTEPYDVVGLSAAGTRFAARLPGLVLDLRRESANPALAVLAGGPAFQEDATLAAAVGADAVTPDAPSAVRAAESLVGTRSRRPCHAV